MIDLNTVKQQAEQVKKLFEEINNQNRIFEQTIESAMKGAPEEDKPAINRLRMLAKKAIALAKEGKSEEAQQIIKDFNHGGKDFK